jgi:hypothetical protein
MVPRPSVTRFVGAVVRAELARGNGPRERDVVPRIVAELHHRLAKLIGSAGFDVLLARALVLARHSHPSLARVTAGPDGALVGLDEVAADHAADQDEAVAIVSNFMDLLASLVGEDLAMRLVRDAWPTAEDVRK